MENDSPGQDWESVIREMISHSTETAPTDPGVYRMPCGACVVDFFVTAEGEERWLVAGDERSYTRETVAIARHGDHPWERLYSLAEAATEIARLAAVHSGGLDAVIEELTAALDDREVERTARDRADMAVEPLTNVAGRFDIDLDQL
jgi:hypothetical protein